MIYLTDGGPHTIIFDNSDMKDTEEVVRSHLLEVRNNHDPARNITWRCKTFCGFGKNGTCDKVWADKQFYGLDFVEVPAYTDGFKKKTYRG